MPSKSPAQAKLMRAAAHTKGGFGGVPQKVGKDFVAADQRSQPMTAGKSAKQRTGKSKSYTGA